MCACECMYMCVFMLGVFFSQFHLFFFQLNFLVCVCWREGGRATVRVQRSEDSPVEFVLLPLCVASGDRTQVIGPVLQMLYCWAILSHFYFLCCFVFETVSYWSWSSLMWLASARAPLFSASPVLRLHICTTVPNFFHMFWGAKPTFSWCSHCSSLSAVAGPSGS